MPPSPKSPSSTTAVAEAITYSSSEILVFERGAQQLGTRSADFLVQASSPTPVNDNEQSLGRSLDICYFDNVMVKKSIPFRFGRIEEMSDESDIRFWQSQSDKRKFEEAWRLVVLGHEMKGLSKDELRFQRSVATFQRRES